MFDKNRNEEEINNIGRKFELYTRNNDYEKKEFIFKCWIDDIKVRKEEMLTILLEEKLKFYFKRSRFSGIKLILNKSKLAFNKNKSFKDYIIKNDFLLPDLSLDITDLEWGYAYFMAQFSKKHNMTKDFKSVVVKICNNDINNKSLIERFKVLIYCNIDKEFNIINEINAFKDKN